jgi:replicative DNA helicase
MTSPALAAALEYALAGLPVIPLRPNQKIPDAARWPEKATISHDEIIATWRGDDPRGIGIVGGHHVGTGYLLILDVDEHDPNASGSAALAELELELGALPATATVNTPTGGRHYYFTTDQAQTNANTLPAGIDTRGSGGFVVAPPSIHPNGGRYEWQGGRPGHIAHLPDAWQTRLTASPTPTNTPEHAAGSPSSKARTTHTTGAKAGSIWNEKAGGEAPGEDYEARTTWQQILEPDGWQVTPGSASGETQWTRPGKTVREGASATTGYGTHNLLKMFSSSVPGLAANETYSKFGYYTATRHAGDYHAAADALKALGYGTPTTTSPDRPHGPSRPAETSHAPAAPEDEWETLEHFTLDHDRPNFPLDALPPRIAAQCAQAAEEMQLTPDLAAQLALTALSAVTAGRVMLRVNGKHVEATNLYNVTALPPSAGKSPTFRMMLECLDTIENELEDAAGKDRDDRDLERRHLEKLRDDAVKKGEVNEAKLHADDLRELPPIAAPRLMADDATPEKLVPMLAEQGGRLALVSTEGGLFGMMTGRYSDKANLDVYLGAWSGDTIRVDRIERGSIVVKKPRLTVGLTVQPSVLAEIGKNRDLVGRGLTARFMYSMPADTVGNRDRKRRSTYSEQTEAHYTDGIIALHRRLVDIDPTDPMMLELSDDALDLWLDWTAERETHVQPHGRLRYMAEWISKCDASVARTAALLHLVSGEAGGTVEAHTMHKALQIGAYWQSHAEATFDTMGATTDGNLARYLGDWLQTRTDPSETIKYTDLYRHAKKKVDTAHDLVPAVDMLVDAGYLRATFDGPIASYLGRGKGASPVFEIHPDLLGAEYPSIPLLPLLTANSDDTLENVTDSNQVGYKGYVGPKAQLGNSLTLTENKGEGPHEPDPLYPSSIHDAEHDAIPAHDHPPHTAGPTTDPDPLGLFG